MAAFSVGFEGRDFSRPALAHGLRFTVERLNWRAMGGPWSARLLVTADDANRLWHLVSMLRCGVRISDQLGPAWWGYVSAVELQNGAEKVRVSLDEMGTRVAVRYREYSPTGTGAGAMVSTAYEVNTQSERIYGRKDRMFALPEADLVEATAYAKTMLGKVGRPLESYGNAVQDAALESGAQAGSRITAVMECRGWWETLEWRFAPDSRGRVGYTKGTTSLPMGSLSTNGIYATYFRQNADLWDVSEAWFKVRRLGNPPSALRVQLWSSGPTPGTSLAVSADVPASAVGDSLDWLRFRFPEPYYKPPVYTPIWAGVRVTSIGDAANCYYVAADALMMDTAVDTKVYTGSVWASVAADLVHMVGGVEETTEQIKRMVNTAGSVGQFLDGAWIQDASGVKAGIYRDGSERGRSVAERLLKMGTSTGGRLLARIETSRRARIYAQPEASAARLRLDAAGRVRYGNGRPLAPSEWAAGEWARVGEVGAAGGLHGYNGAVFIEACAWDAARGMYLVES